VTGVPATASGDVPADLPFGEYLVTAVPPRLAVTGGWRMAAFGCSGGGRQANAGEPVRVSLTPGGAEPVCTAAYQALPISRLQLRARAKGSPLGREGPAVVEVSCVDGSGGRVVLGARSAGEATLPEPLAFLEPTTCTVTQTSTGAAATSRVTVSAGREPDNGDGSPGLPAQFEVAREVPEYAFTVTDDFGVPANMAGRTSILDDLRILPVVWVDAGMFGVGGLVLLGIALRRRIG
jgi:hypothetical protein